MLATYLEAWVAHAAGSVALMSASEAELTSSVTAVLQGVAASSAKAFDGADFLASSSTDLGLARANGIAVDMHGTCAAQA